MTKTPPPGYHLEMGLWAVELVVFIVFAFACMPSFGRGKPWASGRLALVFGALVCPLSIAWMRLEQLYHRGSLPSDYAHMKEKLYEIEILFIAAAAITSVMLLMHSIAWLIGRCLRHKPTLSDNLNPIPQ